MTKGRWPPFENQKNRLRPFQGFNLLARNDPPLINTGTAYDLHKKIAQADRRRKRAVEALALVGTRQSRLSTFPSQMSGGPSNSGFANCARAGEPSIDFCWQTNQPATSTPVTSVRDHGDNIQDLNDKGIDDPYLSPTTRMFGRRQFAKRVLILSGDGKISQG